MKVAVAIAIGAVVLGCSTVCPVAQETLASICAAASEEAQ
jgi:hypothetical protein